jgi:hypothetical protein
MRGKARRRARCIWRASARRALLAVCLLQTAQAQAEAIVEARYDAPTTRYGHAVLGDNIEYGSLLLVLASGAVRRIDLLASSVFEDTAPRLVDVDGDGEPEVLAVESDQRRGARLAVYNARGLVDATPYIGTRFRWLAPLGAADLDGDGRMEIAYIDRPHLAKTLRIWRFEQGSLASVADLPGFTNHRIGERDIAGGIRSCGSGPEMILASADWSSLVAVSFAEGAFETETLGQQTSRAAFARAMSCR